MLNGRRCLHVVFQVGHQVGTVAFDLLIRGNGAEDDLSKLTTVKWTVCDAARPDLEVAHNQGGTVRTQRPQAASSQWP